MKLHVLAAATTVLCSSLSAVDSSEIQGNRRIRHFLYEVITQGVKLSISAAEKEHYVTLIHEHLAHVEGKLAARQARRTPLQSAKQLCSDQSSIKATVCASCSAVCTLCASAGYKALNVFIDNACQERDNFAQELEKLSAMLEFERTQAHTDPLIDSFKERFKTILDRMMHHGIAATTQESVHSEIVPQKTVTPLGVTLLYTGISALAAYHAAKKAYIYIAKVMHAEDRLIETIEKDKAVIAMLESFE